MAQPESSSLKLGIALGSGAARGIAHLGVIQALEEADIPIHYIAGSSIGSLIGAAYASGDLSALRSFLESVNWKVMASYLDFTFPQRGLLEGKKLTQLIDQLLPVDRFDELQIPFCAIATDLHTGEEVRMTDGNLVEAIRSSLSLPGIFTPHAKNSRYLVDGGLVNPLPIDVVKAMGADVVLAVDLNHHLHKRNQRKKRLKTRKQNGTLQQLRPSMITTNGTSPKWIPKRLEDRYKTLEDSIRHSVNSWFQDQELDEQRDPNIFDVIANSINIMEHRITQSKLESDPPDILLKPDVAHLNLFDYDESEATIQAGYQCTQRQLTRIRRSLQGLNTS
ncbi:MAG: patatin-like phospholipase family protein [Bacteroidota bacterium]